jgi:hypothetical protein
MTIEYMFGRAEIILRKTPNGRGGMVVLPDDAIVYEVKHRQGMFDPAFGDAIGQVGYMIPMGEQDDSGKETSGQD